MKRVHILDTASWLISTDREKTYGAPGDNLACAAEFMTTLDKFLPPINNTPGHRAALALALTKIARAITGAPSEDNYIDGAGYLALAGELHLAHTSPRAQGGNNKGAQSMEENMQRPRNETSIHANKRP